MNKSIKYVTSESVASGHPDKVADQISDAILDFFLMHDHKSHVALETLVTSDTVIVAGEIKSLLKIDKELDSIIRNTIKEIGYNSLGFNWENIKILTFLHEQSTEIYNSVHNQKSEGAGDQGTMFGYATDETSNYMPTSIHYAHKILSHIMHLSKMQVIPPFGPDGKSQVTVKYINDDPYAIDNIVIAIQHPEGFHPIDIKRIIYPHLVDIIPSHILCHSDNILINSSNSFVNGGPAIDCGLTGRKIIVDSYGGGIPHGGGAFSGKDPTKVDRSAAYIARYIAKNIVASGLSKRCLINLSYAIGIPNPVMISIDTFGTEIIPVEQLIQFIKANIDLSVSGIKKCLNLERPIYKSTSVYGHFGKDVGKLGEFSWEKLDLINDLHKYVESVLSTSVFSKFNHVSNKM